MRTCGTTCFGSGLSLAANYWQPLGHRASVRPPSTGGCTPAWAGPTRRHTCGPFLMPAHGLPTCPVCLLWPQVPFTVVVGRLPVCPPDCGCWPLAVCEGCRSFVYAFNSPALRCSPVSFAFGFGKFVWSDMGDHKGQPHLATLSDSARQGLATHVRRSPKSSKGEVLL